MTVEETHMCRMFGLVAHQPVLARRLLREAPRSLRTLAREHRDGWGVALRTAADWEIHRGIESADESARFAEVADGAAGQVVIAHVRQKTVGCTALANTHPFRRDAFVFAHNGSITAIPAVAERASARRLGEIEGDTDSERLFAMLLTHIDAAADVEHGVISAVRELHGLGAIGSTNFLLSCGRRLYAHRCGRSLFALESTSVVIASEQLTDEAWHELPERSLVVVEDHDGGTRVRSLL
jgi:predicted glutamine amidotransferase